MVSEIDVKACGQLSICVYTFFDFIIKPTNVLNFNRPRNAEKQTQWWVVVLGLLLACQFLFGQPLHQHTQADCDSYQIVHSHLHDLADIHHDAVDISPDKTARTYGDVELPPLLYLATGLVVELSTPVIYLSFFEASPPLSHQHSHLPRSRAPPLT